jgi:hypothetical protein
VLESAAVTVLESAAVTAHVLLGWCRCVCQEDAARVCVSQAICLV